MDIQEKTYNVVRCRDLERYVKEIYDIDTGVEAGWGEDGMFEFKVDGKLSKWDLKTWAKAEAVNIPCRICLNKLCADGWLSEGLYLVEVMT